MLQFMTKNPTKRLGCIAGEKDAAILNHPFFHDKINWEALRQRKVRPPFRPKIVSCLSCLHALWLCINSSYFLITILIVGCLSAIYLNPHVTICCDLPSFSSLYTRHSNSDGVWLIAAVKPS